MFELKTPVIVVNFKTYEESTEGHALELAKICDSVAKEKSANIIVCVDAIDLKDVIETVSIPVFAQHVDGFDFGGHTGKILPEVVRDVGGSGTLINHSEDQYSDEALVAAIEDCKKEGMYCIVCARDSAKAKEIAKLGPNSIAIEPPELIGGDISVTSADPEIVRGTVSEVQSISSSIPVLCGAGVKNGEDVFEALKLGSVGVLIASGVVKAKDPREALLDLISKI